MAVETLPPPYGNTGVENTRVVGVDYLEFTSHAGFGDFSVDEDGWRQVPVMPAVLREVFEVLPELVSESVETVRAGRGYSEGRMVAGVRWSWNECRPDMGRHYIVTGDVLRYLEAGFKVAKDDLVKRVVEKGFTVTRIDVAVDAVNVGIDRDMLADVFYGGGLVSRSKTWDEVVKRDAEGNIAGGSTFRVGSRTSEVYARFYDKRAERKVNGSPLETLGVRDWWRFEWEFKQDKAPRVAGLVAAGDWDGVRSVLVGSVDLCSPVGANRSRWPRVQWYEELMGKMERGRVPSVLTEWDWQQSRQAFIESAAKWFFKLAEVEGVDELVSVLLTVGRDKMTGEDWQDVERSRGV